MPYPPCSLFFFFFWNAIKSLADQLPGPHPGLPPDTSRVAGLRNFSLLPEGLQERAHTLSCWGPSLLHHPVHLSVLTVSLHSSISLPQLHLSPHLSLVRTLLSAVTFLHTLLHLFCITHSHRHTVLTCAHSCHSRSFIHTLVYLPTHTPPTYTHTHTHYSHVHTHFSLTHIHSLIYTLTYSYSPTHHPRTHAPMYLHTHMLTHPHTQILTRLSQPPTLDNYELLIGSDLI